jgi:hypothetical protein
MGRLEDQERGRGSDGEMGRWGKFLFLCSLFSVLYSSFFLLPSSFFLLTNSRARHPRVQWPLQVGNWEQRVQAKQEECPDLPQSC